MKNLHSYVRLIQIALGLVALFPIFMEGLHFLDDKFLMEEIKNIEREKPKYWIWLYEKISDGESSLSYLPFNAVFRIEKNFKEIKTLYKSIIAFNLNPESILEYIRNSPSYKYKVENDIMVYKNFVIYLYYDYRTEIFYSFITAADTSPFFHIYNKLNTYRIRGGIAILWLLTILTLSFIITRPFFKIIKSIEKGEELHDIGSAFEGILPAKTIKMIEEQRKKIKRFEDLLKTSWESVPYGICVLDRNGEIVIGNKTSAELHSLMEEEIKVGIQKEAQFFEKEITKNAKTIYLRFFPLKEHSLTLLQIEDITEKKREMEREEVKKKFYLIGEAMSSLIHEVRNSLSSLLGMVSLLKGKDTHADLLKNIKVEIMELEHVLSSFTGVLSKDELTQLEEINLKEFLVEIKNDFSLKKGTRKFIMSDAGYEGLKIMGSRILLKKAFLNVLNNALDATSFKNGKIIMDVQKKDKEVMISISDNGKGISACDLPNVFIPFWTKKARGIGLGLSFVKKVIDLHKGEITVESEGEGKGTKVNILLKIKEN